MEHIELFAGCGGLTLGLESEGFKLLFANELSPMASQTFAYNFFDEDLDLLSKNNIASESLLWINSQYIRQDLDNRLRENPQEPKDGISYSDLQGDLNQIIGKLLVGSIIDLNNFIEKNPLLLKEIRDRNIDLVSGGPPCQSFSMAGMRELNNSRNRLPMEFARFVGLTKPKCILLENVSGILRPFDSDGQKYYAWFEVAKAFVEQNYHPICLQVNAKYVGAAQNRPRFIMIALRDDIFSSVYNKDNSNNFNKALDMSNNFFNKEKSSSNAIPFKDLDYFNLEMGDDLFDDDIFSPLKSHYEKDSWFNVKDAIHDLEKNDFYSKYVNLINTTFETERVISDIYNHDYRRNSNKVKRRFHLYQILGKLDKKIQQDVKGFLRDPYNYILSNETLEILLTFSYFDKNESFIKFTKSDNLLSYLEDLKTKKQTQKVLDELKPAPAALSIPDDACHYENGILRTLTVREMARFQSFPDWFVFKSKVTTGGHMRKYEVPQYTQVGNAVPPLLGKALGKVIKNILKN